MGWVLFDAVKAAILHNAAFYIISRKNKGKSVRQIGIYRSYLPEDIRAHSFANKLFIFDADDLDDKRDFYKCGYTYKHKLI